MRNFNLDDGALRSHNQDWEELAANDPLWAIASDPAKKGNRWKLDEFLRTGADEVAGVMARAKKLGLPANYRRALDFGCGVGRVTTALMPLFDEVLGVDISESMLRQARQITPGCAFIELRNFNGPTQSFDFIYSVYVLQHQPTRHLARELVASFVRMLAPGGLLVFQVPCYLRLVNRVQSRRRAYGFLRNLGVSPERLLALGLDPIRMISLPEDQVRQVVQECGGTIVEVCEQPGVPDYRSKIYYCTIEAPAT